MLGAGSSFAAAWAASTASNSAGVATSGQAATTAGTPGMLTVGATATTQLTYNPSPNVAMNVVNTTSQYSIMAANILTDTTNGIEYGTLNTSTGYGQGTKTTGVGEGPSATGQTATSVPASITTWMGGS